MLSGNLSASSKAKLQELADSSQQTKLQLDDFIREHRQHAHDTIKARELNAQKVMVFQKEEEKKKAKDKVEKVEKEKELERETERKKLIKQKAEQLIIQQQEKDPMKTSYDLATNIKHMSLGSILEEHNTVYLVRLLAFLMALFLYTCARLMLVIVTFLFHTFFCLTPPPSAQPSTALGLPVKSHVENNKSL